LEGDVARAALVSRRLPIWLAVCGLACFLIPLLSPIVSAAGIPQEVSFSETAPGEWVINEIHADPASDLVGDANGDGLSDPLQDEFIELFNNTGVAIDISGWILADQFTTRHQFSEGTVVPDRCAIVVFGGGSPVGTFGSSVVQVASSGALGLDDTGDTITLSNGSMEIQRVSYGFEGNVDQSLTRNPDVDGPFEEHLTASAPLNTRFSPGTRLDGEIFWGCPDFDAPPSLLDKQPADGASAIAITSPISVIFSEPVSLSEPWYKILCTKSGEHTAVVNGSGDDYTLLPDEPFAYSENCQVTLFGVAINDLDGSPQPMEADVQWQFTIEAEVDSTPQIVDSYPIDGASGFPLSAALSITFSEPVEMTESALNLSCSDSGDLNLQVDAGPLQFQLQPDSELAPGELCTLTLNSAGVSDLDPDDPPDQMAADWQISFRTDVTSLLLINEIDPETLGIDDAEFIELFDGGVGQTDLDGLAIILFSGNDDSVYASFDLDGHRTDEFGFFLLGSSGVDGVDMVMDDSLLQNGPDAVALYRVDAAAMPVGTAVTTENLIDALVYDTSQEPDDGLLPLLLAGELQVNENARDLEDFHSLQRCPNGSGSQRSTETYWPDWPTPKEANTCIKDNPPVVMTTMPADGADGVPLLSDLSITFSEEVNVYNEWFNITCEQSGIHDAAVSGENLQFSLQPLTPFKYGEKCQVTIFADMVSDQDSNDPPDHLDADYSWSFTVVPAHHIVLNEVDADTPDVDTAEFIELYDAGVGHTSLDGLVVVLFNGSNDLSYAAFDLDGYQTDEQGYFLLGNSAVAGVNHTFTNGTLQNGPDAVTLFVGDAGDFPNGTTLSTDNLLDALVYSTGEESAPGLMSLLLPGEEIVDENGRESGDSHSNQRCPDGAGGQRRTGAYLQNKPTPKGANFCEIDEPPKVSSHTPPADAGDIALDTGISITFSEPVSLADGSLRLICTTSGRHSLALSGGPSDYTFRPESPLSAGETCSAILFGSKVSDLDDNDPPDQMVGDYAWSFETVPIPVARQMVINEVDADTVGIDTAEFIELFDGGAGLTALDGLVIVLFNGADDHAYRRIDLAGYQTGVTGYFVIGGSAVPGVDLVIPDGLVQNGPDAVALYARDEVDQEQPDETGLLDALVYHTNDEVDDGLQFLLLEGEPQINEGYWRHPAVDSNQRCPNGQGGQRVTSGYVQNQPTPGTINNCLIDKPPQVAQVFPLDGASDVALDSSLVVNFDEPVQTAEAWIKLACGEAGIVDLASAGGPQQFTLQPASLAPFDSCTATVDKDKVLDRDGYADTLAQDYVWHFTIGKPLTGICGDEATLIHAVQGNGDTSPLLDTTGIIIEAIVTADYHGEHQLGGFFLQEEPADMDGDPLTSEGLFIAAGPNPQKVAVGETLRLQGDVSEEAGMTSLVNITSWQHCGMDTTVEPQPITLPLDENLSWEAVEGMLVTFPQKLTVINNDRWGSEGIVDLASERLYYPTMITEPGPQALEISGQNQKRHVSLDDGSKLLYPLPYPPYLGPGNTLRLGDTTDAVTGVVSASEDGYRIQPAVPVSFNRDNPRPELIQTLPGRLRVAHLNAGGFFNGDELGDGFTPGHGAQSAVEFERQRAKLVNAILALDAAVIGLTGVENDGYGQDSTIQDLITALNEAGQADTFQALEISGEQQEGFPDTSVLIYRQDLVSPSGDPIILAQYPFDTQSRRPVGQQFMNIASGQEIIVILTQFPERGNCPNEGDPNADQGDGQACWNELRAEAAGNLAQWVFQLQGDSGVELLLIGDLNSYALEEPLSILALAGLENVEQQEGEEVPYSVVTNAEAGTLNYGFVTSGLQAKLALVQRWHINADEAPALDFHIINQPLLYATDPYRSAAQDPLIIDLAPVELSAGFTSTSPVWIGQPVSFTNLSHGPRPLTSEWDFGDGSPPSNETEPLHRYEKIGLYNVTLTVWTSWGETAVYTATVEILPARIYLPLARS
jgi:predicted extracellular nuclease/methionine-rich copper-binding protein CopC